MTSTRQFGKLLKARWGDDTWTGLTADAQWLYTYLVSHPTTDSAGVFAIRVTKWAKGATDMTPDRAKAAAHLLVERGLIMVDHDTEEGLIRTYIADDWAGDNIFKGALGRTLLCQSPYLRAALLYQIRNLGRDLKDDWLPLLDALEKSIPSGFDFGSVVPATAAPSSTATPQPFKRRPNAVRTPLAEADVSFAEFDRRSQQ